MTSDASPLCVLAGAGAGKTRVLTRRIAYQVLSGRADAEYVLALTFTRQAASELTSRIRQLGLRQPVAAGTFHAVAGAALRRWWADRGWRAPTLLSSPNRLLETLAAEVPGLANVRPADLANEIAWAQARCLDPESYEGAAAVGSRRLPAAPEAMAHLYRAYREAKRRRGLMDFDDLLARSADAIEADPRFARAQHWRWRHLFVDEFQDLNPLQYRLLLAWLAGGASLTLVGDPNQAIYGWNGSDPALLADVGTRWASTEVVRLDDNHRCSPQIVAAGAAALGGTRGDRLRSVRPDGPEPALRRYDDEEAEAAGVAAELADAHAAGLGWSRMAVLTRTNAQLEPIRAALEAAGIPQWNPSRGRLLAEPELRQTLDDLRRQARRPVATALADLRAEAEVAPSPHAGRLATLAALAAEYRRLDPSGTVGGWLAWLPLASAGALSPATDGGVCLSSFHRAKGLEWRAVWVCGLEQGLVPGAWATSQAAVAEERRLLYVALTRAEHELHCSWAAVRGSDGRGTSREPSPWLAAVAAAASSLVAASGTPAGEPTAAPDAAGWRRLFVEQAERLREAPEPAERPLAGAHPRRRQHHRVHSAAI